MLAALAMDIAQGEINFPTSAQIALRIRNALYDPDCHVATAARLIQAEPLLAARIVGLANSALYRRSSRVIADLPSAITCIGYSVVRSLATAVVIRQLAGVPADPAHRALASLLWEHTAHMAALSCVLARRLTRLDPDTAMFAGLVHEVGDFYLISRASDFPGLLDGRLAWDWTEDDDASDEPSEGLREFARRRFETRIGRAILDALAVPAPVIEAVEALWQGRLTLPPKSLGDVLLLSEHLAPTRSPLERPQADGDLHGQAVVDFTMDDTALAETLEEAATDIAALATILKR